MRYTAEQAREMGLVNKVVPAADLDAAVKDWTDKLALRSPTAIALAKRSFNAELRQHPRHQQFRTSCLEDVLRYAEIEESIAAFNEKRTPDFNKFTS